MHVGLRRKKNIPQLSCRGKWGVKCFHKLFNIKNLIYDLSSIVNRDSPSHLNYPCSAKEEGLVLLASNREERRNEKILL